MERKLAHQLFNRIPFCFLIMPNDNPLTCCTCNIFFSAYNQFLRTSEYEENHTGVVLLKTVHTKSDAGSIKYFG